MSATSAKPIQYRGHVANGVVVFDEPVALPEGTEVHIEPAKRRTLADRFRNVIGCIKDMPPDLAENHDHYIHGTPKK